MARVRFTADFDYEPMYGVTIAYKRDMQLTVKRDCADQAIAAGKAVDLADRYEQSSAAEVTDAVDG